MSAEEPISGPSENSTGGVNKGADARYRVAEMQREATRLMTRAKGGDMEAFEELVSELRQRAFLIARSLVGSREDALDLCQDAFLKVFRARESYNPTQPFLPWFHRILRNTCFSHLRKQGRIRKQSLHTQSDEDEDIEWEIVDPGPAPGDRIEAHERTLIYESATSQLSSRDREILTLRHHKELSYKEIAISLGIPEGTVMSRLFHARRRLREQLRPLLSEMHVDEQGAATSNVTPRTRSKADGAGAQPGEVS